LLGVIAPADVTRALPAYQMTDPLSWTLLSSNPFIGPPNREDHDELLRRAHDCRSLTVSLSEASPRSAKASMRFCDKKPVWVPWCSQKMQNACHPVEHHDLGARARNPAKVNKQGLFLLVNIRWCLVQKISFNDLVPLIERMFTAILRAGGKILPRTKVIVTKVIVMTHDGAGL